MLLEINWPLWLTTMIPLAMSAGPGNLMVATSGAQSGVRRSVLFIAGLDIAYFVISMLVGLGLYHTLMNVPALVWGLRVAGSLYIMWLGVRLLRRPMKSIDNNGMDLQFKDGVMVQLGNVQGLVMLLVMFSTFIPNGQTSSGVVLALSFALISVNFAAHLIWVSLGATIQRLLRARPELLRAQNAVFGLTLIVVAIWIFIRTDTL